LDKFELQEWAGDPVDLVQLEEHGGVPELLVGLEVALQRGQLVIVGHRLLEERLAVIDRADLLLGLLDVVDQLLDLVRVVLDLVLVLGDLRDFLELYPQGHQLLDEFALLHVQEDCELLLLLSSDAARVMGRLQHQVWLGLQQPEVLEVLLAE